jgi:hypothetical protein
MARLRRRFGLVLGLSTASALLFTGAQVLNLNRERWLGVQPGNAAHNFGFNLGYYLPLILGSALLGMLSTFYYIRSIVALRRLGTRSSFWELATVLPAVPTLLLVGLLTIFILSI